MKRFWLTFLTLTLTLFFGLYFAKADSHPNVNCKSSFDTTGSRDPVYTTHNYYIACEVNRKMYFAEAHLQYKDKNIWKEVSSIPGWKDQGTALWSDVGQDFDFSKIFWAFKFSKVTARSVTYRVVTDKQVTSTGETLGDTYNVNRTLISNEFTIKYREFDSSQLASKSKTSSTTGSPSKTAINSKTITIPNFVKVSVQWIKTNSNKYPGVKISFVGSSCSVSDLLSGDAIVVKQSPLPFQTRPYNTSVTLYTNC